MEKNYKIENNKINVFVPCILELMGLTMPKIALNTFAVIFEMAVGIFNKCFDVSSQFHRNTCVHVAASLIFGRISYTIRM